MSLLAILKDLRHDLGKYIAMQSRWAREDELRETLTADLIATQRSADAVTSAVVMWEHARPRLVEAHADAVRLAALDTHFDTIRRFVDASGGVADDELPSVRDSAVAVSDLLREWYAEVRALG